MLGILKILRIPGQNNCLDLVYTLISQLAQVYTKTAPKSPNV